jgi:hypothetical protein
VNTRGARPLAENPFSPAVPAETVGFVGREREVDLIYGHVLAAQRASVAVSGDLGMGKTSLLRYVADPLVVAANGADQSVAIVYVDVQSIAPFSAARFWQRVGRLLQRSTGFGLAGAATTLLATPEPDIVDLEEFLDALASADRALVLLLDEFEWALQADTLASEADSRNLLAQLASLMRRTPRVLSLVTATERPLVEATRVIESWRGSPFATLFTAVALRPLSREESDALLLGAMERAGADLAQDDRARLFRAAGGVPAALQAAGFSLYHGRAAGLAEDAVWDAVELAVRGQSDLSSANGRAPQNGGALVEAPAPAATPIVVDRASGEVFVGGRRVDSLTALEFNLLECLLAEPGKLRTKEEIVREVWAEELADDTRVEKLVSRLRRKIEPVPGRPQFVRTVRGRGYRLVL